MWDFDQLSKESMCSNCSVIFATILPSSLICLLNFLLLWKSLSILIVHLSIQNSTAFQRKITKSCINT